tara:strand:+ start:149 stop:445 length:297 start_codon:yes stop_codon:yes gene_type:complete
MKKFFLLNILVLFLYSCGGTDVGKVLRNEKVRNTDEFLVKKRDPLTIPPDYRKIPLPRSNEKKSNTSINQILNLPKNSESSKNKSSSVEKSIISELGK